jgi:hypothetical protein
VNVPQELGPTTGRPTSEHMDRIVKVREYRAVPSIMRYVILEYASAGLTVLARPSAEDEWTATADTLRMPEIGIEIPVGELYEGVDLPADTPTAAAPGEGAATA